MLNRPGQKLMEGDIDLDGLLDRQKLGPHQLSVVVLCFAMMVIDGYDLFMIGMTVPKVAADFGIAPAGMAPVLALQNLGLALGTALIGTLSDRFGRKTMLLFSIAGFSAFTLLSVFARGIVEFAVLRMATALFLAGVIPNAIALTNEMTPARFRQGLVGVVFSGYAFGATIASVANGHVFAQHSWRVVFLTAAAAGAAALPLALFLLPESIRFLLRRTWGQEQAARQLQRILPNLNVDLTALVERGQAQQQARRSSVSDLFADGQRLTTSLMWVTFALSFTSLTAFATLGAVVLNLTAGLTLSATGSLMAIFSIGGLVGSALSGFVLDRFGSRIGLWFWYGASTAGWLALGAIGHAGLTGFILMALAGAAMTGAQSALNSFVPTVYPTQVRATGVGCAFGVGRLIAITSPLLFSGFVGAPGKETSFFLALAVPTLLIMFCVPGLARRAPAAA